ncbi:hypothetical protein JTB14_012141 [Gonioctena quinquepunctata]|nr:hypothetical protein JTB14_012141 [Gonioctena quinquepunctata]
MPRRPSPTTVIDSDTSHISEKRKEIDNFERNQEQNERKARSKSKTQKLVSPKVVDVDSEPILGLSDCVNFGLIKRVDNLNHSLESQNDLFNHYSDSFTGTGNFSGTYHIHIQSDAILVVNSPQRVPHALLEKFKKTLERLEGSGIIPRIDEPTNWVHNLVIREKMNGELRLCLDPKDSNSAVRRKNQSYIRTKTSGKWQIKDLYVIWNLNMITLTELIPANSTQQQTNWVFLKIQYRIPSRGGTHRCSIFIGKEAYHMTWRYGILQNYTFLQTPTTSQ